MDKKYFLYACCVFMCISGIIFFFINKKNEKEIVVDIGYQSVTAQTWGAVIIKNQNLFEERLKEQFPDYRITVRWHNEVSGAAINNNMFANKYQIGFMGDMPILINGYHSAYDANYDSCVIAIDGKGEGGKNQGLLVTQKSKIENVSDLENKTISVPIGSSAHHMLLRVLEKYNLSDKVELVHHDVSVASNMLLEGKIDAFAAWDPYPKLLEQDSNIRLLVDGSESELDYLAGVIVNASWAKDNLQVVKSFYRSLEDAHQYMIQHPQESADIIQKETGYPLDIIYRDLEEIEWNSEITTGEIETFGKCLDFLVGQGIINKYELTKVLDVDFIREIGEGDGKKGQYNYSYF